MQHDTRFSRIKALLASWKPYVAPVGIVLAVGLNIVATVSAAMSAYYTSLQSELAVDAVKAQARNEAFAAYISAYTDVCKVSLTAFDQDDFATSYSWPWAYPDKFDFDFEIRAVDQDTLESQPPPDLDKYLKETTGRLNVLWDKWLLLKIWLDSPMEETLAIYLPHNGKFAFEQDKRPPPYVAVLQQRTCRVQRDALIRLYKDPSDVEAEAASTKRIWVVPTSSNRETEAILASWGETEIIQEMTSSKAWPLPP